MEIYNAERIAETIQIHTLITQARAKNDSYIYYDIQYDSNIYALRQLGFDVNFDTDNDMWYITWKESN